MFTEQEMNIQSYHSVSECQDWIIIKKFIESNTAQNKSGRDRKRESSKTPEKKTIERCV